MKYYKTFGFVETVEKAQNIIDQYHKTATPYARKHKAGYFTPWTSSDGKENLFVVFTYYRR